MIKYLIMILNTTGRINDDKVRNDDFVGNLANFSRTLVDNEKADYEEFHGTYRKVGGGRIRKADYTEVEAHVDELVESGKAKPYEIAIISRKNWFCWSATEFGAPVDTNTWEPGNINRLPDDFARPRDYQEREDDYHQMSDLITLTTREWKVANNCYRATFETMLSFLNKYGEDAPECYFLDSGQILTTKDAAIAFSYINDNSLVVDDRCIRYLRNFAEEGITGMFFDEGCKDGLFYHLVGFNVIPCGDHFTHYIEKDPENVEISISMPGDYMQYLAGEYFDNYFEDEEDEEDEEDPRAYRKLTKKSEENIYYNVEYAFCEVCGKPLTRRAFVEGRKQIEELRKKAEADRAVRKRTKAYEAYVSKVYAKAVVDFETVKKQIRKPKPFKEPDAPETKPLNYLEVRMTKPEQTKPSPALLRALKATTK